MGRAEAPTTGVELLYRGRRTRAPLSPSDRLNLGDNAGVQTIALLNIHMIDVRGRIEIDVGNGTSEPRPL